MFLINCLTIQLTNHAIKANETIVVLEVIKPNSNIDINCCVYLFSNPNQELLLLLLLGKLMFMKGLKSRFFNIYIELKF